MSEQDQTILDVPINKNLEGGIPYCQECNKKYSQQQLKTTHKNNAWRYNKTVKENKSII